MPLVADAVTDTTPAAAPHPGSPTSTSDMDKPARTPLVLSNTCTGRAPT